MNWTKDRTADLDKKDTGLRFTDVLFGFVFKEIFFRLADWNSIDGDGAPIVKAHLVLAAVVTMSSYVGFRKSLSRADYKLKFFNLPMIRFVVDQMMVVLYFVLATRTPDDPELLSGEYAGNWPRDSIGIVLAIMVLYVAWDALSALMASAGYVEVGFKWSGLAISVFFTGAVTLMLVVASGDDRGRAMLLVTAGIMILYRVAKDQRARLGGDWLDDKLPAVTREPASA